MALVEAQPEDDGDEFGPSDDGSDADRDGDDEGAEGLPPPLPPPADPPGDGDGFPGPPPGPRRQRAESWGPFSIASVHNRGVTIGYGITCGRHPGETATVCKKQIIFGSGEAPLTALQCQMALKRWVLFGFDIALVRGSRQAHVALSARDFVRDDNEANAAEREAEVRARLRAVVVAQG